MGIIAASIAALTLTSEMDAQELVSFPTGDGGVVFAHVYGAGERGVVLAHGGRFTKESWTTQAEALAHAGFRTVAIDFRGRGQSRGGAASTGDEGVEFDVLAAIDYLRQSGTSQVAVVGASFGGWAAARASVRAPGAIDRLVLLAASPVEDAERLIGRKLFIVSREDFSGGGALRLPGIQAQYQRAPEPKELVILEGSAHAQHLFETDQAERLWQVIMEFLNEP